MMGTYFYVLETWFARHTYALSSIRKTQTIDKRYKINRVHTLFLLPLY